VAVKEHYRTTAQYYTLKLRRLNQLARRLENLTSELERMVKEARGQQLILWGRLTEQKTTLEGEIKELKEQLLKLQAEIENIKTQLSGGGA